MKAWPLNALLCASAIESDVESKIGRGIHDACTNVSFRIRGLFMSRSGSFTNKLM